MNITQIKVPTNNKKINNDDYDYDYHNDNDNDSDSDSDNDIDNIILLFL